MFLKTRNSNPSFVPTFQWFPKARVQRACPGAAGFQDLRGARGPDKDHSYWVPTLDQTKDIRKKRGKWIHPMCNVESWYLFIIRVLVPWLKSFL